MSGLVARVIASSLGETQPLSLLPTQQRSSRLVLSDQPPSPPSPPPIPDDYSLEIEHVARRDNGQQTDETAGPVGWIRLCFVDVGTITFAKSKQRD